MKRSFVSRSEAVQQNGKQESIFNRPAKKQAFGEVNKNTIHNQGTVSGGKNNDKFVIQSKENPTCVKEDVFTEKKKLVEEESPFDIYNSTCNGNCSKSIEVIWAENALMNYENMAKKIEEAKKFDDFAWEKQMIFNNIQKSLAEESDSILDDFRKKCAKEPKEDLLDDFKDLLVLPDPEGPVQTKEKSKPKQSKKFQIFEDDIPDFVPVKKNKRALALRRL